MVLEMVWPVARGSLSGRDRWSCVLVGGTYSYLRLIPCCADSVLILKYRRAVKPLVLHSALRTPYNPMIGNHVIYSFGMLNIRCNEKSDKTGYVLSKLRKVSVGSTEARSTTKISTKRCSGRDD